MTSKRYAWKRYKLATLLVAVALCAGIVAIVRIVLNPPVPAAIVQGRVVYSRSGSPALTVVHAQMVKSANGKPYGNGRIPRYAMAVTDMNGLYTLPKMEAGRYNIWAEKSGYTMVALDFFRCEGSTTAPDFRMIRGGVISGRVIDADTGQPAKREGAFGATIGLHGPSRPASGAAIDSAPLQDDGTFFIRAAPGRNVVYVPWARTSELSTASVVVLEGQTITVELKVTAETGNKGTEP